MSIITEKTYRCDFCDKLQGEVEQIIAGKRETAICNECVALSVQIIEEKKAGRAAKNEAEPAPETTTDPAPVVEPRKRNMLSMWRRRKPQERPGLHTPGAE